MLNSEEVKRLALAVGFDDCGIARADALTDDEYPLHEWLRRGWHGDLSYMERNTDKRMDPRLLVPGAKSVICLVSAYPPPDNIGGTAAYARTREYHKDIKQMLFSLRERLGIDGKCCCDTVPISDKHWAARAGLGWIGRHTLLVTPRWGSWVNLGEIVTTEECSEYSDCSEKSEYSDFCAKCNRCVAACPNRALASEGPSMLNVTRCTSYYTTHRNRPLPPDVETHGYTQGCDLCQLACPFNRQQSRASAQ
ncbi:MAG: epoxyqueuosine reductase [bacterium]